MKLFKNLILLLLITFSCSSPKNYDILIKNGAIVDGLGNPAYLGSVGINGDTIAAVGKLNATGTLEIDAADVHRDLIFTPQKSHVTF